MGISRTEQEDEGIANSAPGGMRYLYLIDRKAGGLGGFGLTPPSDRSSSMARISELGKIEARNRAASSDRPDFT